MYPSMFYPHAMMMPTQPPLQPAEPPPSPPRVQVSPLVGGFAKVDSPTKRLAFAEELIDEVVCEAADALKLTNAEHTAVKVTLFENYVRSYESLTSALEDGMLERFLHPALADAIGKAVKDLEAALTADKTHDTPDAIKNPERFSFGAIFVHVATPLRANSARMLATLACDLNPLSATGNDILDHVSKVTGLGLQSLSLSHENRLIQRMIDPLTSEITVPSDTESNIVPGCTLIAFVVPSLLTAAEVPRYQQLLRSLSGPAYGRRIITELPPQVFNTHEASQQEHGESEVPSMKTMDDYVRSLDKD